MYSIKLTFGFCTTDVLCSVVRYIIVKILIKYSLDRSYTCKAIHCFSLHTWAGSGRAL